MADSQEKAADARIEEDRRATAEARAAEERRDGKDGKDGYGRREREPEVNKLFRAVMKFQGSDLHLKVGQPPMMRLRGDMVKLNAPPLSQEDMERLLLPQLKEKHR